ncbi:unnamed protein product, partial [marine sediment metagenome]
GDRGDRRAPFSLKVLYARKYKEKFRKNLSVLSPLSPLKTMV